MGNHWQRGYCWKDLFADGNEMEICMDRKSVSSKLLYFMISISEINEIFCQLSSDLELCQPHFSNTIESLYKAVNSVYYKVHAVEINGV